MPEALLNPVPGLSRELSDQLVSLCDQLSQSGGQNVCSVTLYGGLARGHYRAGISDVNLLLLLDDPSIAAIAKIAPTLHAFWRSIRVEPYIVGSGELARTVEDFPTRFWDMKHNHVTLAGEDPFANVTISWQRLCQRVEQELRNLSVRLRRGFVLNHDDPIAQARRLSKIVVPLAVSLAALLQLSQRSTVGVFKEAASAFSLDAEALAFLKQLRRHEPILEVPAGMFDRIMTTVAAIADVARSEGSK